MKDKQSILQLCSILLLGGAFILVLILFFNVSARMTAIEQKQAVFENRLEVIRTDGLNLNR